jgi:hypothetical protein
MQPLVGIFALSFYEPGAHSFDLSLNGMAESKMWKWTVRNMIYCHGEVFLLIASERHHPPINL